MFKTIALDYDDTFTAMPDIFSDLVKSLQNKGHKVYCVTARRDCIENRQAMNAMFEHYGIKLEIIFCNHDSKYEVTKSLGIKIDIWIDDSPWAIVG